MTRYRVIMESVTSTPALLFHVAFADDWEACSRFGEYSVATRGVPFDEVGAIYVCEYADIHSVLKSRYSDASEPLLLASISTAALISEGIDFTLSPDPRILEELPMTDGVIAATFPIGEDLVLPNEPETTQFN